MKKTLIICLVVVLIIAAAVVAVILCTKEQVKAPTLTEIAEKYNNNEQIKSYAEMGYYYKAAADDKKLTLTTSGEGISEIKLDFSLDENILSGSFNLDEDSLFVGVYMTNYLVASIEELNGYNSGEFNKSLTDERIMNYTLEKEGLLYKLDDNNHLEVKVDLTKKAPLLDFSDVYIKVEDLEDLANYIREGSAQTSAGYVVLNSFNYDGKCEVKIAEKDELTKCSYNSLKSFVQVLFDSEKAVEYLENNYKGVQDGNKEFNGVKIETDVTLDESEKDFLPDDSCKVMRVTIDVEAVQKAIAE